MNTHSGLILDSMLYHNIATIRRRLLTLLLALSLMIVLQPTRSAGAGAGEWTWMSGSDLGNQPGSYGVQGVPDSANTPGERYETVAWTDLSGNLWLFGGNSSINGPMNDLWRYQPTNGMWTWVGGSSTAYQRGIYGVLGTPAPGNVPGARWGAVSWIDGSGNLWLFGGYGGAVSGLCSYLNDLWRYELGAPLAVTLASFDATAQSDYILVTWETVSEISNSGFKLYRGESDAWDSATMLAYVPSQAPGSAQGFAYSFADADVQPEQTVWYWLEDIDLSGTATLHGPVSATMQTPTAVTLTALDAGSPPVLPPVAAGIVALAVAAGFFLRRNLQSCPIDRVD